MNQKIHAAGTYLHGGGAEQSPGEKDLGGRGDPGAPVEEELGPDSGREQLLNRAGRRQPEELRAQEQRPEYRHQREHVHDLAVRAQTCRCAEQAHCVQLLVRAYSRLVGSLGSSGETKQQQKIQPVCENAVCRWNSVYRLHCSPRG